jgi:hypothetical protein
MAAEDEDFTEDTEFDEELVEGDVDPEDLDEDVLGGDEEEEEEGFGLGEEDDTALEDDADDLGEETGKTRRPASEDEDDDEDLIDPDDVEADLDTILKDRLVAAEDEPEDDEEEVETDDRGDPVDRIQPRRPGEFVCQSCFLLKHPSQLADPVGSYCADCV